MRIPWILDYSLNRKYWNAKKYNNTESLGELLRKKDKYKTIINDDQGRPRSFDGKMLLPEFLPALQN